MPSVLAIDITSDPIRIVVSQVDKRKVEIVEHHELPSGGVVSPGTLLSSPILESPAEEPEKEKKIIAGNNLFATILKMVKTPWQSSLLIVPGIDSLSLNIELPFQDAKNINKVIDLELQDIAPFDIGEFFVQYQPLGQFRQGNMFDVHVSTISKPYLQNLLKYCEQGGFEPVIVSTPASVIGGVLFLAEEYFNKRSALIYAQGSEFYIALSIDGVIRTERIIHQNSVLENDSSHPLMAEIKLTLASAEKRYERTIENVYLFCDTFEGIELQQNLGRSVERIRISDLIRTANNETELASLGSVFAQNGAGPSILTNFRTREFSYSPQLREFLVGLKSLIPYAITLFVLGSVCLTLLFYLREQHISKIHDGIKRAIHSADEAIPVDPDKELLGLQTQIAILDRQLSDLGSPSDFSPLDAFLTLSKTLSLSGGDTLNRVFIKGNKLRVELKVADYTAVDRIEKALKAEKEIFCRVKKETSGLAGNTLVTFDIRIC